MSDQNSTRKKLPNASLSLDLDNKWSYLKTHGDPDWESFPSYFDLVIPRFLDFFEDRDLKITVFHCWAGRGFTQERGFASFDRRRRT